MQGTNLPFEQKNDSNLIFLLRLYPHSFFCFSVSGYFFPHFRDLIGNTPPFRKRDRIPVKRLRLVEFVSSFGVT